MLETELKAPSVVSSAYQGTNAQLIRHVAQLYVPGGALVADVTYGRGAFWTHTDTSRFTLLASDRLTCPARPYDFRQLPYRAESLDVVVLDPPYIHNPGTHVTNHAYKNAETTAGMYHADIMQLYRDGMTEAVRVLRGPGQLWVKCKDEVESGTQRWSHLEICTIAVELGLFARDLFILLPHAKPNNMRWPRQQHARKNHSYLWVFTKGMFQVAMPRTAVEHLCVNCGEPFRPQRSTGKYCEPACRQAAYRERIVTVKALADDTLA
jgi:hypothetical protein